MKVALTLQSIAHQPAQGEIGMSRQLGRWVRRLPKLSDQRPRSRTRGASAASVEEGDGAGGDP
jgi:hypothetical protein